MGDTNHQHIQYSKRRQEGRVKTEVLDMLVVGGDLTAGFHDYGIFWKYRPRAASAGQLSNVTTARVVGYRKQPVPASNRRASPAQVGVRLQCEVPVPHVISVGAQSSSRVLTRSASPSCVALAVCRRTLPTVRVVSCRTQVVRASNGRASPPTRVVARRQCQVQARRQCGRPARVIPPRTAMVGLVR